MSRRNKLAVISVLLCWPTLSTLTLANTPTWHDIGSPELKATSDIEVTPNAILAGEYATVAGAYNGVFISKDLGNTWTRLGLQGAGVSDIEYRSGKTYVATINTLGYDSRLYVSSDGGANWESLGPGGKGSKVTTDDQNIYYGTHTNGLWMSADQGTTWYKVNDTTWGTSEDIIGLESSDNLVIASTPLKTFISKDHGDTWNNVAYLNNKYLRHFSVADEIIMASGYDNKGLFLSQDTGSTWTEIPFFYGYFVGDTEIVGTKLFAARKLAKLTSDLGVYVSEDGGVNWSPTSDDPIGYNVRNFATLVNVKSSPDKLLATGINLDIYDHAVKSNYTTQPFLRIPWIYASTTELLSKINTFFDHEYPLLGSALKEPLQTATTTLNFLGLRAPQPELFYSSHNGIDFDAPYGSQVLAAADGNAYYYYCTDCGNSIKIRHDNGYESTYMHLQYDDLITYSTTSPTPVSEGDVIGLVGMTGKTTGPHIHFSLNKTGIFPNGLTDPFGWLSSKLLDPWKGYLGIGQASEYVWKDDLPVKTTPTHNSSSLQQEVVTVKYDSDTLQTGTLSLIPYSNPNIQKTYAYLSFVPGTSYLINLVDFLGAEISQLDSPLTLEFDLSQVDLTNLDINSLKVYFFDTQLNTWVPMQSSLDLATNVLTAVTSHLSWFAVFGNKVQSVEPITTMTVSNNVVTLEATAFNGTYIDKIFFSVNGPYDFQEYTTPFEVAAGITNVQFRSLDSAGNLEIAKNQVVIINTGQFQKKLRVPNSVFTVQ